MTTELEAVEDVLSDPDNVYRTAQQVAERVLEALSHQRRRLWRYIVIAQDRDPKLYDMRFRFGVHPRRFFPTYAKGPFQTLADARRVATAERRAHPMVKVMTARVFEIDADVDTEKLEEVSA